MSVFMSSLKDYYLKAQDSGGTGQNCGAEIKVLEENKKFLTRLIKLEENVGFGVTAFKEKTKSKPLLKTDEPHKVVFIALDTTSSMYDAIHDIAKQISTILKLSSSFLPVKLILALYGDYLNRPRDHELLRHLHFIHVSSEAEANDALREYWVKNVRAYGGGDNPEMNLTLMATIIKYYTGIVTTDYTKHGFEVKESGVTSPQMNGPVNCAIIQITDAENRDVCDGASYQSPQGKLEYEVLQKFYKSLSKWSDIDGWCVDHKVPYICLYVGSAGYDDMFENYIGPWSALPFAMKEWKISSSLGAFLVALLTCLLEMTSLDILSKYEKDILIPIFKRNNQSQVDADDADVQKMLNDGTQIIHLPLESVVDVWRQKIGEPPVFTSGKIIIETLQMDEGNKEKYYKLCMTVATSDYFSVMTSNPAFAEIVTALKTTWSPQQVQDFQRSLSDRLNMSTESEKESYATWRESGKTLATTVGAMINEVTYSSKEEDDVCEVVRLQDETARDSKSTIGGFDMQNPKCVEALFKFLKGLKVVKTTKRDLGADLKIYTSGRERGVVTFAPVIDKSALSDEVIKAAASDDNEVTNLDALQLRGIMRLYNQKLFLTDMSMTAFAMMCVLCARWGSGSKRVGQMGEEYLASLRKKGTNWLLDPTNPQKFKAESCGALYSQVIQHFWELHADDKFASERENMVTSDCWRYMTTMVVMHLAVYKEVKLPVLEMEETMKCRHFSILLPSLTQVDDKTRNTHFVVCEVCSGYMFKGATLKGVCESCISADHLIFKCKNARSDVNETMDCLQESAMRNDFDGEMYCKMCSLARGGADNGDAGKQVVSFVKCGTCGNSYAICNEKDFSRTAKCFVCIFINDLRRKFKHINDLKSFLGDMSNPTLMVIQLGIMTACEGGYARTSNFNNFRNWFKNSMKDRNGSDLMNRESDDRSEIILKKICVKPNGGEETYQQEQRDAPQNPQGQAEVKMRLPKREKKMAQAKKRKAWKVQQKLLSYRELTDYRNQRREKRSNRQHKIAEKKREQNELLQSSEYEVVLKRVRDTFTRTCSKCKLSVMCSPETEWDGCLVCDQIIDPTSSPYFKQVQRPLREVVPLEVLNRVALKDAGVKLEGESWKDLKNLTSLGQFFRHIAIQPREHADEKKMEVDDGHNKEHKMVQLYGQPFNFNFIISHLLMLNNMLHGKDLSSAHINEMKGVCVTCGDSMNYMYSFHTEGSCSGMICRQCATRNYWVMIKEAKSSSKKLSAWLSCMCCRQFCGNMRNIWVWIGAKRNIRNAVSDITDEEYTYFQRVLNALSESKFRKLKQELESSPNAMYNICHQCLQLKGVSDNQLEPPAPCGAPEPMEDKDMNFVCVDCSRVEASHPSQSVYPEGTVEAALFQHQMASSSYDKTAEFILSRDLIRQCPKCQHDIVKESGCMVMHCPVQSCRVEFCFICGAENTAGTSMYVHVSNVHNVSYFGGISPEGDPFPPLTVERVDTPNGTQYLYVFDSGLYYFNVQTMRLESNPQA